MVGKTDEGSGAAAPVYVEHYNRRRPHHSLVLSTAHAVGEW
jgi:hypothetical protein